MDLGYTSTFPAIQSCPARTRRDTVPDVQIKPFSSFGCFKDTSRIPRDGAKPCLQHSAAQTKKVCQRKYKRQSARQRHLPRCPYGVGCQSPAAGRCIALRREFLIGGSQSREREKQQPTEFCRGGRRKEGSVAVFLCSINSLQRRKKKVNFFSSTQSTANFPFLLLFFFSFFLCVQQRPHSVCQEASPRPRGR